MEGRTWSTRATGEVFFVIETEKVANEIEASADGCIGEIRVLAGASVPVGEVLATWTNAGWLASAAADPARPTASNVSALTIRGDAPVGSRVVATPLATSGHRFAHPEAQRSEWPHQGS